MVTFLPDNAPIAVFDSGLGGLTVAKALRALLPHESILYFGDTARLPYGTKSPATVHRFSRQCLRFMSTLSPKMLVVACNTASALALEKLKAEFDVPVVGVLEPGAQAAVETARQRGNGVGKRIGLIATEATIASNAYPAAIRRIDPGMHVIARACPLLVPLIEEGRESTDPIVKLALAEYLKPFVDLQVASLILGCTHYPILAEAIAATLESATKVGGAVSLVDSARQTALVVQRQLATMSALTSSKTAGSLTCYVTDQSQRFERLASRFLGQPVGGPMWVTPEMLEDVDSSEYRV